MRPFSNIRRRNQSINTTAADADLLEPRLLLSATSDGGAEDDGRGDIENEEHGVDNTDNRGGTTDDNGAAENEPSGTETADGGIGDNQADDNGTGDDDHDGINNANDDNGHDVRGVLSNNGTGSGNVSFESEIEHGLERRQFTVDARGLTAGTIQTVTVDGVEVGTLIVGDRGFGRLSLSDSPNQNAQAFPTNFPTISGTSIVEVGTVLSGTIANVNPATQVAGTDESGTGDSHIRVNLTSTGTVQGRATFEGNQANGEFTVEVWNGIAGEQLDIAVNGITVGQVVVNQLGFGQLQLANGGEESAFSANWSGIVDGTSVVVGTQLSGVFSGGGRIADASPAEFNEAYDLDQRLELQVTSNMFKNWGGLGEKWLHGDGGWYFITPDGSLSKWDGQAGANGTVIANLDVSFYDNPELLYNSQAVNTATVNDDLARYTAADLDHDLELESNGNYYENWGGLGEKWLKGSDGWYFVTPDGSVYHWTSGSGMNGELVAGLDSRYHADPTLLTSALQNLTTEEAAFAIDRGLNLQTAPSDFLNWGGLNEKWLRGDGGWYFITEDGSFYSWDGKPTASGTLITTLSATYYDDLSLLASVPNIGQPDFEHLLDDVFASISGLLNL